MRGSCLLLMCERDSSRGIYFNGKPNWCDWMADRNAHERGKYANICFGKTVFFAVFFFGFAFFSFSLVPLWFQISTMCKNSSQSICQLLNVFILFDTSRLNGIGKIVLALRIYSMKSVERNFNLFLLTLLLFKIFNGHRLSERLWSSGIPWSRFIANKRCESFCWNVKRKQKCTPRKMIVFTQIWQSVQLTRQWKMMRTLSHCH